MLYELKNLPRNVDDEQVQCDGDPKEEDGSYLKQPLLYAMINQPNLYISQQKLLQKVQVNCVCWFHFIPL